MKTDSPTSPAGKKAAKAVLAALILVAALAVAAALVMTRPRPPRIETKFEGPLVEVMEARPVSLNMPIFTYGTVRSGQNLILAAQVKGTVVDTAAELEEGTFFPQGALLIRIDPRDYRLAVESIHAEIAQLDAEDSRLSQEEKNLLQSLAIAQESLSLTRAEYERNLKLSSRGAVSRNQVDQSRRQWLASKIKVQDIKNALALISTRADSLKARRLTAEARLKRARLDLERTQIRAPFPCRIAEKMVEKGQFVSPGSPLLRIYDTNHMEVEVHILPQEALWLHTSPGQWLPLSDPPPLKARLTFEAGGHRFTWKGSVCRIKAEMDQRTRTLPLVIKVDPFPPGARPSLIPGMFVKVEIMGRPIQGMFLLPLAAIQEGDTVYVAQEGKVRVKRVKVLRRLGDLAYVGQGLAPGDLVITRFPGVISAGMKVRVKKRPPSEGGPS